MNILVYGFYGKQNKGDNAFEEAIRRLFQAHSFVFCDHLIKAAVAHCDAIFIGGGSLLDGAVSSDADAWALVYEKPLVYISIGAETDIHPHHLDLMSRPNTKLIAIRNKDQNTINKVKAINENVITIPDIVYSTNTKTRMNRLDRSILFLPNISILPNHSSPSWETTSWLNFKSQIAQTFDYLIDNDYIIRMFPMCIDNSLNDLFPANEIIGAMKNRSSNYIITNYNTSEDIKNLMSEYKVIITQRFHGAVFAELSMTPYITISHHEKLNHTHFDSGKVLSYYSLSKDLLLNEIRKASKQKLNVFDPTLFDQLKTTVKQALSA